MSEQKKQNINFKSEQNCKEFVAKVPFDINLFDKKGKDKWDIIG